MGDDMLHFGRVLGGAQHQHALVFFRDRVGNLTFQIKLFLTTDKQIALHLMRGSVERGLKIAALQVHRWQHVGLCRFGGLRRQDRR